MTYCRFIPFLFWITLFLNVIIVSSLLSGYAVLSFIGFFILFFLYNKVLFVRIRVLFKCRWQLRIVVLIRILIPVLIAPLHPFACYIFSLVLVLLEYLLFKVPKNVNLRDRISFVMNTGV